MKILITGICGFVGSELAKRMQESIANLEIFGVDNFIRRGSETNRETLARRGIGLIHADLRSQSDFETLPHFDYLIDAAANPSVLAGADGKTSSRQLMEHNLVGTINTLEACKQRSAGFILLSTSRVYSIQAMSKIPVIVDRNAYVFNSECFDDFAGVTANGVNESFSTQTPISLYGASKLASEALALEYGATFGFPVWINRCGVLAGAGQFGKADQGIFAYWINSHMRRRPLKYIGFDGRGHQVRDCLHPADIVSLIEMQMREPLNSEKPRVANVSGGIQSAMSLNQLTQWCDQRFGSHAVTSDSTPRAFDIPWLVLDSELTKQTWGWQPTTSVQSILEQIADHGLNHPNWLELSQ